MMSFVNNISLHFPNIAFNKQKQLISKHYLHFVNCNVKNVTVLQLRIFFLMDIQIITALKDALRVKLFGTIKEMKTAAKQFFQMLNIHYFQQELKLR